MTYKIVPLPVSFLDRARCGIDDQAFSVEFFDAEGGEPLRDVLRRAQAGERIALGSYSPHRLNGPFKEYGPIYFSANQSGDVVALDTLPIAPRSDYFNQTFVLRAYSDSERIVDSVLTLPDVADAVIAGLFENANVAFILARFAAYGCYGCRIERA